MSRQLSMTHIATGRVLGTVHVDDTVAAGQLVLMFRRDELRLEELVEVGAVAEVTAAGQPDEVERSPRRPRKGRA
jgi:hypothetical protein